MFHHAPSYTVDMQNQCIKLPGVTVSHVHNLYELVVEPHWYKNMFMTHGDHQKHDAIVSRENTTKMQPIHLIPIWGEFLKWGIPKSQRGCFNCDMRLVNWMIGTSRIQLGFQQAKVARVVMHVPMRMRRTRCLTRH